MMGQLADPNEAYRGVRLDPGIRRDPGDTAMLPAAQTFGDVVGSLVIPQSPLDYASMFAFGPAGKLASKGVRAGALALGGLFDSDQAGAGPISAIKRATEAAIKAGGYKQAPEAGSELLAIHNTRPERLASADKLGGLAVPSIGIAKPSLGFKGFGDISMIADPMMVKPARNNPVFAADAYSPTFPSLNDEGTKIFRGFTDMGNRRYAPLTLDNLVREMRGNVRGGEGHNYGAGSVRAHVTPQFRDLKDIQNARDKIIPEGSFDAMKQAANNELIGLANKFHPYSKYSGNSFIHTDDFADMLGTLGPHRMGEHYKPDLPPELLDEARAFRSKLRNMPSEYFEAKPQRGVRLNEFSGAVVPDDVVPTVAPILERHGVPITPYQTFRGQPNGEAMREAARREALQEYRHLFFGIPAAAGTLGALASQDNY